LLLVANFGLTEFLAGEIRRGTAAAPYIPPMTKTADPRPAVVLTGFGTFPGTPENVSGDLVKGVVRAARREMPEYRFAAAVLPTEWERAPRALASLHKHHAPLLALHFGIAAGTRGFRLETKARNVRRPVRDAAGLLPVSTTVLCEESAARRVTIEMPAIAARLRKGGYSVSLSDDAGGYLCNAILYHSLVLAEQSGGRCRVGFVHIPTDLSKPPLTLPEAVAGALEIVKFALEPLPRQAL
jgi:pyroglutamyl-peptidase